MECPVILSHNVRRVIQDEIERLEAKKRNYILENEKENIDYFMGAIDALNWALGREIAASTVE